MKASIFIATYNKLHALSNTLYSINRQKTSFSFEVCLVDDGSSPLEAPFEVADKMLTNVPWKLKRLNQNVGCAKSQCECLSIMDKESEAIVLQSSDVLYAGDDVLEKLIVGLEPMTCTMGEVKNVKVPENLYREWDRLVYYLMDDRLSETLLAINSDPRQPERGRYTINHTIFQGPRQVAPDRRWYFFLGAIRHKDIYKTCFRQTCYDVELSNSLHKEGFKVKYIDGAIGIHQKHPIGG